MWEKFNPIQYKLRSVVYFVVLLMLLAGVTPVLADYLGPNRTVTQSGGNCQIVLNKCSYVASKKTYNYKSVRTWSCASESKPWKAYPSSGPRCTAGTVGAMYWSKEEGSEPEIITYPPAIIEDSLQNCTLNNEWCTTSPQLVLSGQEPLSGYEIIAIEGTLNGQNFACPGSNCSVPLIEGNNALTYWALSSWGDSSTMDSLTVQVDSQLPVISGTFSGTTGSNGWYLTPVSFIGSATDATSGLASFTCTLDGITLSSCNSLSVNDEGLHTLVLTALDHAGNSSIVAQDISIDTQPPTLSSSLQGMLGANTWYNAAELNATATDPVPGSGLAVFEYSIDGTGWAAYPSGGILDLPEGKHSVDVRATDGAGHSVSASKSFWLDSVAPNVILDPQGTLGTNNWYITNLNLAASVSDDTSGVDIFEYTRNGSAWTMYTAPLLLTDGSHSISFWAQDQAGLVTQVDRTYRVDTVQPQIAGSISGTPGTNGWYVSNVTLSASASDPLPGSGVDAFTYILDGSVETPYTSALTIPDGLHTIRLNVQDQAGLTYFTEQSLKVDTIRPSLTIQTTLPEWIKDEVTLAGSSADSGSGLSKVEISTDGGRSWKTASGTTSWSYKWNTARDSNGLHQVIVRAVDQAGLTTEQTLNVAVDNQKPSIVVPASWLQWQTVTLDVWDEDSGLSVVRIEISDPTRHYPKRTIQFDYAQFPISFKWDRRAGDNSIVSNGSYDVVVIAIDQLGHVSTQYASITVLIDFLPAGPTATAQPYYRVTPTPLSTLPPVPASLPAEASTPVVSMFGEILPAAQVTATPEALQTPREVPTQASILEWLESVLIPGTNSEQEITELETTGLQSSSLAFPGTDSNILWGAAAAAMVGAVTSYALEEKRKREAAAHTPEPEEDPEEALQARKAKSRAKKMKKLEAQWADEKRWEQARFDKQYGQAIGWAIMRQQANEAAQPPQDFATKGTEAKIDRFEAADAANEKKLETPKTAEQIQRAEQLQDRVESYQTGRKQAESASVAAPAESNWWEKTKSFVSDNIFEPFDQYIYTPIIQPAIEKRNEVLANTAAWLNEKVYQPYIAPKIDNALDKLKDDFSWINETIVQPWVIPFFKEVGGVISDAVGLVTPYIAPVIAKAVEWGTAAITWFNESVYQPHILPALQEFNESVYQPYLAPLVGLAVDGITSYTEFVTEHIYEPIFAPIVNDINKHIVKPYVDPAIAWWDKTWDEYGEWVHNGLDAVGFIPGLGDIMDGVNSIIYVAEGRYLEASISAAAMIPVLGDLAKTGKFGLKVGAELVEEAAEKMAKEVIEEATEQTTKAVVENVAQKAVTETAEELAEKSVKDTLGNATGKLANEIPETLSSKALTESVKNTAENVAQKTADDVLGKAAKDTTEAVASASAEKASKDVKEQLVQQALQKADDKTASVIRSLERKLGDDVVSLEKGISLLQKHGDAAIRAFNGVNLETAQKMLKTLDGDVLDFAIKEGSGAFEALSRWPESDLLEHGVELALRAKKDALVLEATRKFVALGPFDPAHITSQQRKLINQIAENSITYADEAQAVIGKYVGLDGGFLDLAKKTGSLHYSPHPDVWNTLESLGIDNQKAVAWLVNQQAIQTAISKGLPFEYCCTGIPEDILEKEALAIRKMFSGCTEKEIMELLESPYTFRMMELQELQKAGYEITIYETFDNLPKSYILVRP